MPKLQLDANVAMPDELYEAIVDAHQGLTLAESQDLNARLILLLANHIGDLEVVREALAHARETIVGMTADRPGLHDQR